MVIKADFVIHLRLAATGGIAVVEAGIVVAI